MHDEGKWSTPNAAGATLRRAIRAGRFPEAFAEFFADLPLSRAELIEIGREEERARLEKSAARTAALLNRLGVKLAHQYLRPDGSGDPRFVEFVDSVFHSANSYAQSAHGYGAPYLFKSARAFFVVLAVVELAIEHGALACDVNRIADAAAELVPLVLRGQGLSVTDARNAIAYFTTTVSLSRWIIYPSGMAD